MLYLGSIFSLALAFSASLVSATPIQPQEQTGVTKARVTFSPFVRLLPGEDVYVVGNTDQLGGWTPTKGIKLDRSQYNEWAPQAVSSFDIPVSQATIEFKFVKRQPSGAFVWEGGSNRRIKVNTTSYQNIEDIWHDDDSTPPLGNGYPWGSGSISFTITAPVTGNEKLYLVGNTDELGNWQPEKAIPLSKVSYTSDAPVWWTIRNFVSNAPLEFKFIKKNGNQIVWEKGDNRVFKTTGGARSQVNGIFRL